MFTVASDPQFTEEISVPTPQGDGWTLQRLKTTFRVLPVDQVEALDQAGGVGAILERAVVAFHDLADEAGEALDGSAGGAWRGRLLALPHVRMALLRGYSEAVVRARAGNSASSAAAGPPER